MENIKKQMLEIGKLCFQKGYTETCGSSITVKHNEYYLQSPSGVAYQRWDIDREDILVLDHQFELKQGRGYVPADAIIHWDILEEFNEFNACLHVHGKNSLVFACANKSIPPITEQMFSHGEVKIIPNLPWEENPVTNKEYPSSFINRVDIIRRSENVSTAVRGIIRKHKNIKKGVGVLLPNHGIILCGNNLNSCYDLLERIEHNAYVSLLSKMANIEPKILL